MIIAIDKLIALRRNPQYLSERQNKALRTSIERDGFLCPAVVRKKKDLYEILRDTMRTLFLDSASREKTENASDDKKQSDPTCGKSG